MGSETKVEKKEKEGKWKWQRTTGKNEHPAKSRLRQRCAKIPMVEDMAYKTQTTSPHKTYNVE